MSERRARVPSQPSDIVELAQTLESTFSSGHFRAHGSGFARLLKSIIVEVRPIKYLWHKKLAGSPRKRNPPGIHESDLIFMGYQPAGHMLMRQFPASSSLACFLAFFVTYMAASAAFRRPSLD